MLCFYLTFAIEFLFLQGKVCSLQSTSLWVFNRCTQWFYYHSIPGVASLPATPTWILPSCSVVLSTIRGSIASCSQSVFVSVILSLVFCRWFLSLITLHLRRGPVSACANDLSFCCKAVVHYKDTVGLPSIWTFGLF